MKKLLQTANKNTLLGMAVHLALIAGESEAEIMEWLTSQRNDNPLIMQDIFPSEAYKKLFLC